MFYFDIEVYKCDLRCIEMMQKKMWPWKRAFIMNKSNSEKTVTHDRNLELKFVNELESVTSAVDCHLTNYIHFLLNN